jgi:hypothetical protein
MLQANNHSPASTATIAIAILDLTTPWAVNRSALLAESVFDGVRAKMAHLRTGLQERDATIAAVQQVGICHVCVCALGTPVQLQAPLIWGIANPQRTHRHEGSHKCCCCCCCPLLLQELAVARARHAEQLSQLAAAHDAELSSAAADASEAVGRHLALIDRLMAERERATAQAGAALQDCKAWHLSRYFLVSWIVVALILIIHVT